MTGDGHVTESKIAEQSRQVIENKRRAAGDGRQFTVASTRSAPGAACSAWRPSLGVLGSYRNHVHGRDGHATKSKNAEQSRQVIEKKRIQDLGFEGL